MAATVLTLCMSLLILGSTRVEDPIEEKTAEENKLETLDKQPGEHAETLANQIFAFYFRKKVEENKLETLDDAIKELKRIGKILEEHSECFTVLEYPLNHYS